MVYCTLHNVEKVIVLDECTVLHVGMPSVRLMPLERLLLPQRQPVVRLEGSLHWNMVGFIRSVVYVNIRLLC